MLILKTQTTQIFLPNPTFSDSVRSVSEVNAKTSVDNTRRTYVKSKGRQRLRYTFIMAKSKSFELKTFIDQHLLDDIIMTNHKDEIWVVKCINDSFTHTMKDRTNRAEIILEFDGVRTYAPIIDC